ncbi:P-type conjugative transfer protein VirB9 [Serratia marcescens]|jgi:type IV secretion system protein VirB9|uniref:P-type conjugative transfer protein VirB9 n=2 Tax=Enterobacterales TaxID=91347 RepID=A0ABX7D7V7_SERLI|nr:MULTISPECIES: P-type conjugative transfer protein VirB9 [Enterobacterales]EMB2735054.1 P-type conjugative transfer protein VirB9 [Serratia marcescens]MCL9641034.1 P-type conjugative transfer protein VirB9 [Rahnella victoriana]QMN53352.1 P-type conjugative transfer protein VirB9 [Citrobacter freundii]HEI6812256.1 P-type conjugative transfer protein VirB9 [Yersinia enterocolitica]EKU4312464.1 P-type conjugative transfer protein VirB9 [Klebsiella pneumoniae]
MMLKHILLLTGLLASCVAWSSATPRGSAYDSRMQNVTYNSQNVTVVSTRPGYVTMLVFDDDETVIDAQAGFPRGWTVTKSDNRVGVSPNPIAQPVTDASGNNISQVFLPTAKDWKTNLFVVTSKRDYSLELNVLDKDSPAQAFIIRYHYPDELRKKSAAASATRQQQQQEALDRQRIASAFRHPATPRNWRYTRRVAAGSASIAPDFAWDDGRFAYIGFSPAKTLPSVFRVVNGQEQAVTPGTVKRGNYTVMVVPASPQLVLRYGSSVVGIENDGFGRIPLTNSDTVSPSVTLEAK